MSPFWDIRELSEYLNVKRSTLYAWVEQRKIPFLKIHGLIRFQSEEIDRWLESFRKQRVGLPPIRGHKGSSQDLDALIARAKREVYTPRYGKPDQDRARKEGNDGSV